MSETNNGGTPNATTGYLVSDLVGLALEQLGVGVGGQNADPQGLDSGVMHLNMMLAQWQRREWLVPNLTDVFCMATGKSVYYVGPGGDIDMPVRPAKVMGAYARLLFNGGAAVDGDFSANDFDPSDFVDNDDGLSAANPIDYPLTEIPSYQDYAALGLKGLKTWPSYYFYNPAFPLGEFRPWPIPAGGNTWQLHLIIAQPLPSNLKADTPLNLPPEYWDAVMWCLAARLAPSYGQEASATVATFARASLSTIRTVSFRGPTLAVPAILTPISNPFYWPGLEIQKL